MNHLLTCELATFVIVANVSKSIIENQEFQDLLPKWEESYIMVPGKSSISGEMDKLAAGGCEGKVQVQLNNVSHLCRHLVKRGVYMYLLPISSDYLFFDSI